MEKIINILSINPGSTSIKYSLFKNDREVFFGHFKKTGSRYLFNKKKIQRKDFESSVDYLMTVLQKRKFINKISDISKFGIRVVHGGNVFKKTTHISKSNLRELKKISNLAPLHNPSAIKIVEQILKRQPKARICAVFDTAFHQSIPVYASTYALPRQLSDRLSIKKYGFHGIACESNLYQVKKKLGRLPKNIIICHLGGGCSITAVKDGQSIDTSMGFTPLEGLMMITRSGDLDNGVIAYLAQRLKKSATEVIDILNNKSGIFGITKIKDMKTVVERAEKGDKYCKLAVEMFVYRIVKYIYAYYGVLHGLDLLVFSGGIGEGSRVIRKKIHQQLKMIGLKSDSLLVVHVDENREILRQMKTIC